MPNYTDDVKNAVARLADRRVRAWNRSREVQARIDHEQVSELHQEIHPYVTIARETGAGGSELAHLTAQKLGWRLLDHQLLEVLAETYHIPESQLASFDEKPSNWLSEIFAYGWDRRFVSQVEYLRRLEEVIQQAALNSSTVVVGRGAQFFLPPERGLRIWLIAPLPKRIERVGMLHGFNRAQSREYIERTDREYRDFVSRYFHHDVADPHLYDEVFNTEHLKLDEVADIIVDLCREHFIS